MTSASGFFSSITNALLDVFKPAVVEEFAMPSQEIRDVSSAFIGNAVLPAMAKDMTAELETELTAPDLSIIQHSALISPFNPQGVLNEDIRGSITTYAVKEGDNLSEIAKSFGITVNTLLWANDIRDVRKIKPGDMLVILPVSGVKYVVKKGDTLGAIAKKYKGSVDDIAQFNGLAIDEVLIAGTELIIPDGEIAEAQAPTPTQSGSTARFAQLQEHVGYYLRPIIGGRNSRTTRSNPHGIHGFNGVDLASMCGNPVMASAEGTVLVARSSGWNGGYGRYVVIAHKNGTQTLYGHMLSVGVVPGQRVNQGQEIGKIGSSGNSTGCHVHFEIRGAKNPF